MMFLGAAGSNYLAELIGSRQHLSDSSKLLSLLDEVIEAEIELALMGAKKAKSEVIKNSKDNVVRPIK
jgi:hypothetical protein